MLTFSFLFFWSFFLPKREHAFRTLSSRFPLRWTTRPAPRNLVETPGLCSKRLVAQLFLVAVSCNIDHQTKDGETARYLSMRLTWWMSTPARRWRCRPGIHSCWMLWDNPHEQHLGDRQDHHDENDLEESQRDSGQCTTVCSCALGQELLGRFGGGVRRRGMCVDVQVCMYWNLVYVSISHWKKRMVTDENKESKNQFFFPQEVVLD
jgi:hypothetical protein